MIPAPHPTEHSSTSHAQEVEAKRAILERAIDEHGDYLLACVVRLLRRMNVFENSQARSPGDIAGDVLADACLAVLRSPQRFDANRDPLRWIMGHAINVAKRERERVFQSNRAVSLRAEVCASEIAGEEQSGEEALEEHEANLALSLGLLQARKSTPLETRQALASLLAPLRQDEREIVVLSVFEGYDSPRLAARLGISAPAARKRLQRALDRLRLHIRGHEPQFAWIENLPALLGQRHCDPAHGSRAGEEAQRSDEMAPPEHSSCHSQSAQAQHPEHDLSTMPHSPRVQARPNARPEPAHAQSSNMKILSSLDSPNSRERASLNGASSNGAGPQPTSAAGRARGGEPSP